MSTPLERSVSSVRLATPDLSLHHDPKIANLPIIKTLDKFDKTLNSLLLSISTYNPSIADAEALLPIDKELRDSLKDLVKHKESGLEIKSLEAKFQELNDNCKQVLLGLSDCRSKLSSLQSLDMVEEETKRMNDNKIPASDVLQYAMKLAKFTTAPASAHNLSPADFIWPSERALRSGMLAVASLNTEKLLGDSKGDQGVIENEDDDKEDVKSSPKTARRSSFVSYGDGNNDDGNDVIEDLDLFDPDEL